MLKTLGRTLIILMAAGLIGLGWYVYTTTAVDQSITTERYAQTAPDGEEGERREPPSEGEGGGSSLTQLFSGMGLIVGQTAAAVIVVTLIRMLIQWLKPVFFKKHKTQSSKSAPAQLS